MALETPETTKASVASQEAEADVQEMGAQVLDAAGAVSASKEKTKKFEGLSQTQKDTLKNQGVASITPDKTPEGHDSTALRFDPNTKLRVNLDGKWENVENTVAVHITHYDTEYVKVRSGGKIVTIMIYNSPGSEPYKKGQKVHQLEIRTD